MYKKNVRQWLLCFAATITIGITAVSCGDGDEDETDTDTDTTMNMQTTPPSMEDTSMFADSTAWDTATTRPIVKPNSPSEQR